MKDAAWQVALAAGEWALRENLPSGPGTSEGDLLGMEPTRQAILSQTAPIPRGLEDPSTSTSLLQAVHHLVLSPDENKYVLETTVRHRIDSDIGDCLLGLGLLQGGLSASGDRVALAEEAFSEEIDRMEDEIVQRRE